MQSDDTLPLSMPTSTCEAAGTQAIGWESRGPRLGGKHCLVRNRLKTVRPSNGCDENSQDAHGDMGTVHVGQPSHVVFDLNH